MLLKSTLRLVVAFHLLTLVLSAQEGEESTSTPASTIPYIAHEFLMPYPQANPVGLDVLEVRASLPGTHPLALITHGTGATLTERAEVTPWRFLPQALWFARRGYVVFVIVRRGYGRSGGEIDGRKGGCGSQGSFTEAAEAGIDDLNAVARYASRLPEVDASTIISTGVSTGGFLQVGLSAHPMANLKATISFAGGRGGDGKGHNCNLDGLVSSFHGFGKHNAVPMLWIYSENDRWFPPDMAKRFDDAFKKDGGTNDFQLLPPDGDDGHHLFGHVSKWSSVVEGYLRKQNLLPLQDEVLPPPTLPNTPPPAGLPEAGLGAFHQFLANGPFKAFATNGAAWGYSTGQFTQAIADHSAIESCKHKPSGSNACAVVQRTLQ